MLRFRNPGTQYSTQVTVIRELYRKLGDKEFFTLDDMAVVIAQSKMMTAYGYEGDDAIKLSNTPQESMNSALMNAKMYAEVFRMLGWVTPYGKKSYPLVFTYIGIHVALSEGDCSRLYEQCVLGINSPTELSDRMSYTEEVRIIVAALRSIVDLGGVIYKHELNLGAMSVNDTSETEYQAMITRVKALRGDIARLNTAFQDLANSLGMKLVPVDNCTRLPIALLKTCGYVVSVKTKELYNVNQTCIKITDYGRSVLNHVMEMKDIRLSEFRSYTHEKQNALIRLGIYSMLIRAGYDLRDMEPQIQDDRELCADILQGKEILFSPYQTIRRDQIEEALGIAMESNVNSRHESVHTFETEIDLRKSFTNINRLSLVNISIVDYTLLTRDCDLRFLSEVDQLKQAGLDSRGIVDQLFKNHINDTQTEFYPLISTLFRVLGYNCSYSRPGDNGARWDAIIEDEKYSVPIEIKSPTEELHISIKAIRQALENKIILLSRRTYNTTPEITSLAVGYYLPNDRAEVSRLIHEFKVTYGYKIGVIDFKSLLTVVISKLVEGIGHKKDDLYYLEGLIDADF